MNFTPLTPKTILFLGLLLFCYRSAVSQSLRYGDVKRVMNIDSLENSLAPQKPNIYISQLLSLEKSRFLENHKNFGGNIEEVRKLTQNTRKQKGLIPIFQLWEGLLLTLDRKHAEATVKYQAALKAFRANADMEGIITTLLKLSELHIGQVTIELRNIELASSYAKEATELSKKYGDKELIVKSLNLQFAALNHRPGKEDLPKAEKLSKQMLEVIGNEPNLQRYRINVANSMAIHYNVAGRTEQVYKTFKSILEEPVLKEIPANYYSMLLNIAYLSIDLKKYDEAAGYLNQVLDETKGVKNVLFRSLALSAFKEVYSRKGNYQKALVFADSSFKIKEEIYKTENVNELNKLEAIYKNKEIKSQNEVLSLENTIITNRNRFIIIGLVITGFLSVVLTVLLVSLSKSRKQAYLQTVEIARLSSVRDQYINIVAHDLRSPILAMQGMYGLVKESIKKQRYDDLEKISCYIDETGIKTTHLLDNLFKWGMSQREELTYEPVLLNVREEVSKVLSVYESLNILKGFVFLNNCPETTTVFADRDSVQLILRNLVDNATKHLPSEQGQIDINVVEFIADNMSRISICNNGSVINNSQLEIINRAFIDPTKAQIGEQGLGLGIVNIARFVEKNAGRITVDSNIETGTKFEIYLPTKKA